MPVRPLAGSLPVPKRFRSVCKVGKSGKLRFKFMIGIGSDEVNCLDKGKQDTTSQHLQAQARAAAIKGLLENRLQQKLRCKPADNK